MAKDRSDQRVEIQLSGASPTRMGRVTRRAPLGILGGYIQDKLAAYQEPARTRAEKGQEVGFSKAKYHASLLALTSLDLKVVAKEVGATYGVLRVWRSEAAFKATVQRHLTEFYGHFIFAVSVTFVANRDKLPAHIQAAPDAATFVAEGHLFDDAALYSDELLGVVLLDCLEQIPAKGLHVSDLTTWPNLGRLIATTPILIRIMKARKRGTPQALRDGVAGRLAQCLAWLLADDGFNDERRQVAYGISLALKLLYES